MIKANELRSGNQLYKGGIVVTIDPRSIFDIWDESDGYSPIPLTKRLLERYGFMELPHFTVCRSLRLNIGRGRVICVAEIGTPNEMVFLNEEEPPVVKSVTVLKNYDYDGYTYFHQLQNIIHSITGQDLHEIHPHPLTRSSQTIN